MNAKPTILIIFGTSGDLVKRYIIPAILELKKSKKINHHFKVIGVTRQVNLKIDNLIDNKKDSKYADKFMMIHNMDGTKKHNYLSLISEIKKIDEQWQTKAEIIVYFSLPPKPSLEVAEILGQIIFFQKRKIKILLEKPFGENLKTAKIQIKKLNKYFTENQIYRVDHYLFKKIINKIDNQKIKISNKDIESISVNAFESIDVSNRLDFYDKVGALKDMIQSHLLELTAVLLNNSKNIKNPNKNRYKTLKNLELIKQKTQKGQYKGYINPKINPLSQTETFASIILKSKEKNIDQILITLNTGKALDQKSTYIKIKYKNKKVIFVKEKINQKHNSYEQVILSAINSKKDYFVSKEEVLETWRIINPIISQNKTKLFIYKKGINIEKIKPHF